MASDPTISAAGMRLLKLLVGNPPQTVADLIKVAGVTRTAVTEQLNELLAAGFVARQRQRLPGRGRPRHLYSATNSALLLLFGNSQRLVVPAIWRAIEKLGGRSMVEEVFKHVGHSLAEHYKQRINGADPRRRLQQMIELLREEGSLLESTEEDGQLVLRKRSCPFISMVDDHHTVCCVDQEMMTEVVGCPVRRTACRYEGAPCCTFEIVEDE